MRQEKGPLKMGVVHSPGLPPSSIRPALITTQFNQASLDQRELPQAERHLAAARLPLLRRAPAAAHQRPELDLGEREMLA